MYAKNIKCWKLNKDGHDEFGIYRGPPNGKWWTYDLYFCKSHRPYGTEGKWARNLREIKSIIRITWRTVQIYP